MNLFIKSNFILSSGQKSGFKIECDALTNEDWECLAHLASEILPDFKEVVSVPTGGDKFAKQLNAYCKDDKSLPILICDDVLTTGGSMAQKRQEIEGKVIGVVAFSRGQTPNWVYKIWQIFV